MSDKKIKTALEKALERAAAMPEISDAEVKRLEYMPKGQMLAAKYLQNDVALDTELAAFSADVLPYVREGITDTLLKNLTFPTSNRDQETTKKVLTGFYFIKKDQQGLTHLIAEIEDLFNYYLQVMEQARASVKNQLMHKFQAAREQLEAQYGGPVNIDIEQQPEFQNELFKALGQVKQRFEGALQGVKNKLRMLP